MSFANEHIQIFLNKSPYVKKEGVDLYASQAQHRSYDPYNNMLNFLPNKIPQANIYSDELDVPLDTNYHKMSQPNNMTQRKLAYNSAMYSSPGFDLYAGEDEVLDAFKGKII